MLEPAPLRPEPFPWPCGNRHGTGAGTVRAPLNAAPDVVRSAFMQPGLSPVTLDDSLFGGGGAYTVSAATAARMGAMAMQLKRSNTRAFNGRTVPASASGVVLAALGRGRGRAARDAMRLPERNKGGKTGLVLHGADGGQRLSAHHQCLTIFIIRCFTAAHGEGMELDVRTNAELCCRPPTGAFAAESF